MTTPSAVCPSCGGELSAPGTPCGRCAPTALSRPTPRPPAPPAPARPADDSLVEPPPALDDASTTASWRPPAAESPALESVGIRRGEILEGKWRIEEQLGAGGMGTVYAAHDIALDRKVAIKVLNSQFLRDEEFVARFEREARATAKLEHPNVVPVHAVGRHNGSPFMVMKKLEGHTLAWHLEQDGKMPPARVLELMRHLCAGLAHLHAHGCVHRDFKAGNIVIGPTGIATILDFGILRDSSAPSDTQVGTILGTPRYMSPEQAKGAAEVDHRADLYALGVLLFECLTGRAPFESESNVDIIHMHAEAPAPDINAIDPSLPPALGDVMRRALAKDPAERFPSAESFLVAVEAALAPAKPIIDPHHFDPSTLGFASEPAEPVRYSMLAWRLRQARPYLVVAALIGGGTWAYLHWSEQLAEARLAALKVPEDKDPKPDPGLKPPPPIDPKKPTDNVKRPARAPVSKPSNGILRVWTVVVGGKPYPAKVLIDGVEQPPGNPVVLEVTAAAHTVRAERAGFQPFEKSVIVGAGVYTDTRAVLEP